MYTCDQCSPLILDYLYELLDSAGTEQVRAHLEECAACRTALAQAEKQQQLFARAAQIYRSVPPFQAPETAASTTIPEASTGIRDSVAAGPGLTETRELDQRNTARGKRSLRLWPWLTLAAALLLTVGTLAALYQQGETLRQQAVAQTQEKMQHIDGQLVSLTRKYEQEQKELPAQLQNSQLQVRLQGNAVYNPVVGNAVHIETRSLTDRLEPTQLQVCLKAGGQKLLERAIANSTGAATFMVPTTLAAAPGSQLQLEVRASNSVARSEIEQNLLIAGPAYITHLALNKSHFRAGETVFFRSLTLERFRLQPPGKELDLICTLLDAQGKPRTRLTMRSQASGLAGGRLTLAQNWPEGEYTLQVAAHQPGSDFHFVPQSYRFVVLSTETPQLALDRDAYRPAEVIHGNFRASPPGSKADGAAKELTVRVLVPDAKNGAATEALRSVQTRLDLTGNAYFSLQLPKDTPPGKAVIEAQLHDGKRDAKITQEVPVVPERWHAEFFPEGGPLAAGVPNRVYARITSPAGIGLPTATLADGEGQLIVPEIKLTLDAQQKPPRYTALFQFTPKADQTYHLRLLAGKQLVHTQELPRAAAAGVALTVANPVADEQTPLVGTVYAAPKEQTLLAVATCRGELVAQRTFVAGPAGAELNLTPAKGTCGVVRLTIYEASAARLIPRAERLLYRVPAQHLNLTYQLRQRPQKEQQLGITVRTEAGQPATGWGLALVVEENAAPLVAGNLPAFFFLRPGADQPAALENLVAPFPKDAAARQRLEQQLAIEGWRRFVEVPAAPLLACTDLSKKREMVEGPQLFAVDNAKQVQQQYGKALHQQQMALREEMLTQRETLVQERQAIQRQAQFAQAELVTFRQRPRELLLLGLGLVVVALLLTGLILLLIGVWRLLWRLPSAAGAFGLACAVLLVCIILYGGTVSWRVQDTENVSTPLQEQLAERKLPALPLEQPELRPLEQRNAEPSPLGAGYFRPLASAATEKTDQPTAKPAAELARNRHLLKSDGLADFARRQNADKVRMSRLPQRFGQPQADRVDPQAKSAEPLRMQARPAATAESGFAPGLPQAQMPGFGGDTVLRGKMTHENKGKSADAGGELGSSTFVREYAYREMENAATHDQDTLLWQPALTIQQGQAATLPFDVPDNRRYRVLLLGHDASGRLGFVEGPLPARQE